MGKHKPEYLEDDIIVKSSDSCMKNTVRFTEKGFLFGAVFSAYSVQHMISTHTIPEMVGRSLTRFALPSALTGGVFAATTCLMDDIRGRDKPVTNGIIGGVVAGFVIGAKYHNPWASLKLAAALGALGGIARGAAVGELFSLDREAELEKLNKTLYMGDIAHLGRPRSGTGEVE